MLAAAWFTAVATGLLALFAIATAWYARKAFFKQSEEVSTLQRQFADQQEANRKQAQALTESHARLKRDQASRVNVWEECGPDPHISQSQVAAGATREEAVTIYVGNTSEQLVHDLRVHWNNDGQPWGEPDRKPLLMPGERTYFTRPLPPGQPSDSRSPAIVASVYFQDAAGVHWRKQPGGGPLGTALPDYEG